MDFIPSQRYELLQNADMVKIESSLPLSPDSALPFSGNGSSAQKRRHAGAGERCRTLWMTRLVPFLIAGLVGFGLYASLVHNCINYLLRNRHKTAAAIVLIVLLGLFLFLAIVSYIRTFIAVKTNPGFVPLYSSSSAPSSAPAHPNSHPPPEPKSRLFCRSLVSGSDTRPKSESAFSDDAPEAPELPWFYTKSVFICESDGLPRWCSQCQQRKPDRAHHSSDLGRCIYKMDHFCPWVGGVVSETSFKFFTQFNFYCFAFSATTLASSAYCLALRLQASQEADGVSIACIVMSAFFGLFAFLMFCTSVKYIMTNQTNVDIMKADNGFHVAVLVDTNLPTTGATFTTKTYPLDPTRDLYPMPSQPAGMGSRTFAILWAESGENLWDLGWKRNWMEIMGHNIVDWFLPLDMSPCAKHTTLEAEYPVGPLVAELKARYQVPEVTMQPPRSRGFSVGSFHDLPEESAEGRRE